MPPAERHNRLAVVRERLEAWEAQSLSRFASLSAASAGRLRPEPPDDLRTEFQRDRDRVVHTNSFRRMKHKTQVFIAPIGDHFVTRLTHTLEVTQIARTVARVAPPQRGLWWRLPRSATMSGIRRSVTSERWCSTACSREGFGITSRA